MVDEGLSDEGQCDQGRVVVVDGENVVGVDYVEGVDGVDGCGAEKANGVEEVTDYVLLGDPAVLAVVVNGGLRGGLLEELLSPALAWYRYDEVLGSFEYEIYSLH